jgi:glycerophosphoryl diester phosphodiesterase
MKPFSDSMNIVNRIVMAFAVVTIIASSSVIVAFLVWGDAADEFINGKRPSPFYGLLLDANMLDDYGMVFGIAHNSGDTLATTRSALAHGADVIEIDVDMLNGRLISTHDTPLPRIGGGFFRGPTLEQAWQASAEADVVQLDLKRSTPAFLALLFAFLDQHQDDNDRMVIVSTRDVPTLYRLRLHAPQVYRFLSIGSQAQLERLENDADLIALTDGVTIRQNLVNEQSMGRLREMNVVVIAWTVNDLVRANELVRFGVDGIVTDNLAIVELLGRTGSSQERLMSIRSASETTQLAGAGQQETNGDTG